MKIFPLTELSIGRKAVIDSFTDEAFSLRLLELGCLPGEQVEITDIAPMGDPIAISIYGHKLSLRKKEAECILVK
jgi:ferrous iron transport protein A